MYFHNSRSSTISYKRFSREKELCFIKKTKLSYYYDVDEKEQDLYLKYFFEVFPLKKRKYFDILDEMRELEKEIKRNDEMKDLTSLEDIKLRLSQLEDRRRTLLDQYIDDSKKYRDRFLKNYYRMILSVVLKLNRWELPLEDVIEEGTIGLMYALQNFDVESGYRFSSYAYSCIKGKAEKYILKNRNDIPTTSHVGEKLNKIYDISSRLLVTLHRLPTVEELAEETGYSVKVIQKVLDYRYYSEVSRFDDFLNRDSEFLIYDSLGSVDFGYENIEEEIFNEQLSRLFRLAKMGKVEKTIFRKRYGLEDGVAYSLSEIGRQQGFTTGKVSKIVADALKKVREVAIETSFFDYDKVNDDLTECSSDDDLTTDDVNSSDSDYEKLNTIFKSFS